MTFKRGNPWAIRSRADAHARAKRYHACLDCRYNQTKIYKGCPNCGSRNRQYFMSHAELKRGMTLLTMQSAGTITGLRFQPRYDLIVNSRKISAYTADAEYRKDGVVIYEDTKAAAKGKATDSMDKYALHKIKHFEAQYGVTVHIPQRESGSRHTGKPEFPVTDYKGQKDE